MRIQRTAAAAGIVAVAAAALLAGSGAASGGSGTAHARGVRARVRITGGMQGWAALHHENGEYAVEPGGGVKRTAGKILPASEAPRVRLNLSLRRAAVTTEPLPGEAVGMSRGVLELGGIGRLHVLLSDAGEVHLSEELSVPDPRDKFHAYGVWMKAFKLSAIAPPAASIRLGEYVRSHVLGSRAERPAAVHSLAGAMVPYVRYGEVEPGSADRIHIPTTREGDTFRGHWINGRSGELLLATGNLTMQLVSGSRWEEPSTVRITRRIPAASPDVKVWEWFGSLTISNESHELPR